jgi:hypothetical protein
MTFRNEVFKYYMNWNMIFNLDYLKKNLRSAWNLIQFYFGDEIESTLDTKVTRGRLFYWNVTCSSFADRFGHDRLTVQYSFSKPDHTARTGKISVQVSDFFCRTSYFTNKIFMWYFISCAGFSCVEHSGSW